MLVGLFKSGVPFCEAVSFLLTSPILNPAIITLMLAFFGVKATVVYAVFTFAFAVVMGLVLDKVGFEVVLFLLLGAGIGAFIYEFVPTDLLANYAVAVVTGYVFNFIL